MRQPEPVTAVYAAAVSSLRNPTGPTIPQRSRRPRSTYATSMASRPRQRRRPSSTTGRWSCTRGGQTQDHSGAEQRPRSPDPGDSLPTSNSLPRSSMSVMTVAAEGHSRTKPHVGQTRVVRQSRCIWALASHCGGNLRIGAIQRGRSTYSACRGASRGKCPYSPPWKISGRRSWSASRSWTASTMM